MELNPVIARAPARSNLSQSRARAIVSSAVYEHLGVTTKAINAISGGVSSSNYLAETREGKKYVVRIEQFRTLPDLISDVRIAQQARRSGVSSPPLPDVVLNHRGWPLTVRRFVEGQTLEHLATMSDKTCRLAGHILGRLHSVSLKSDRPFFYSWATAEENRNDVIRKITTLLPLYSDSQHSILAHEAIAEISQFRKARFDAGSAIGLLHVDYKHANLLQCHDGSLMVLDWEKACVGPVMFDLSFALFHFLFAPRIGNLGAAVNFLVGYNSVQPTRAFVRSGPKWIAYLGAIFFLTDLLIHLNARSLVNRGATEKAHSAYFENYCFPAYAALVSQKEKCQSVWDLS